MADMSRAVRGVLQEHGANSLSEIPDAPLGEFISIIAAFLADLRTEQDRRRRPRPEGGL